jgi:hypothetical protein
MTDLIERAYFCRCMSRFIDSVLSYRERKGYISESAVPEAKDFAKGRLAPVGQSPFS